ncbi:MAG: cytochrome c [Bacteroidia bacterium]|jgi:hypothetical protein|nr:cytochrome c [Bacteroidia bacterium]
MTGTSLLRYPFALLLVFYACSRPAEPVARVRTTDPIPLSAVRTELPEHPDKMLVMANCLPCHSLAYIANQPPMKREAWKKTVRKMIDVFGAPVPDTAVAERITDYLASIRGSE